MYTIGIGLTGDCTSDRFFSLAATIGSARSGSDVDPLGPPFVETLQQV